MLDFLGRTHLLILHLPIGILLLAAVLEWAHLFTKIKVSKNVCQLIYLIGAAAAIMACISGNLLAGGFDYSDAETFNHFWAGIVTASLASIAFFSSFTRLIDYRKWIAIAIAISIAITGHLGGSLTHGEGFLLPKATLTAHNPTPVFNIEDIETAEVYHDLIVPIFDAKCIACHGPNKIKGKLRLDGSEAILAGGKSSKNLLGDRSEIVSRIELTTSNDKHMPPKQKPQLTEDETKIISWWISSGGSFEDKVEDLFEMEEMLPIIASAIKNAGNPNQLIKNIPAFLPESTNVDPPNQAAVDSLRNLNVVVLPAGLNSPFLEVNFINVDSITDDHWEQLAKLTPQIVKLKVSNLHIEKSRFVIIASMENMVGLTMNNTNLEDGQIHSFVGLKHLRYLNINQTAVTDIGLNGLSELLTLQEVYAFQTGVTLDTTKNGAKIVKGNFRLQSLETDTLRFDL